MALTALTTLEQLNLVGNPIEFGIETDNYLVAAGLQTQFSINIASAPTVGNYITFVFPDGNIVTFTVAASVDDTGNTITSTTTASTVATQMLYNKYIRDRFTISTVGSTLNFTAIEKTAETNISFSTDFVDFEYTPDVTGVEDEYNENFAIRCDVLVETVNGSNNYEIVATLSGTPNDDDQVYFDVSDKIQPYVSNEFEFGVTTKTVCTNPIKRFKLQYYEYYGATPKPQRVYVTSAVYALKGSLRFIGYNRDDYDSFADYFRSVTPFLTWRKRRRVTSTQKEWLYWWYNTPLGVYLKAKIYYTDGTNTTRTVVTDTTSSRYDLVCYAAGLTELNLDSFNPSKTIRKYELWIQTTTGVVQTETITFVIEESNYLDRYFYYANSLGGFETLRTVAAHVIENTTTSEEARRNIEPGTAKATTNQQIHTINISDRNRGTAKTGSLENKTEKRLLMEFFRSDNIYTLDELSGDPFAVVIEQGTQLIYEDDNHLYNAEFEYTDAFINRGNSIY